MLRIALVCGGSSEERGISLNSARSVYDHIHLPGSINMEIIYYDEFLNPYKISDKFLYSNTPSDFDFKLDKSKDDVRKLSKDELIEFFKSVDIVFPLIHGYFGEDGKLQDFLEKNNIPFIGSNNNACKLMYNKGKAKKLLENNGYHCIPRVVITKEEFERKDFRKLEKFVDENQITKTIVKPTESGSSIAVYKSNNLEEIKENLGKIFESYFKEAIVEEYCIGKEFTVIVLENGNKPVSLIPIEIEVSDIFDYGKKYTPSNDTHYYCPPRFSEEIIMNIRQMAEKLFSDIKANDFLRIDGWYLDDGNIYFSDFNPISGMEQNSFMFQQSSRIGLTHQSVLKYIIKNACDRYNIDFPNINLNNAERKKVNVIFGGETSEKDVSISSGTNVWLKLLKSKKFESSPYFLENNNTVWKIPYSIALSHNSEEIIRQCKSGSEYIKKLNHFGDCIRKELNIKEDNFDEILCIPSKMTLDEFLDQCKKEDAFVFLGLHGGFGENGGIQSKLEEYNLLYNGSDSEGSKLGMDKYEVGLVIDKCNDKKMRSARKISFIVSDFKNYNDTDYKNKWDEITNTLNSKNIIVKPQADGSSAGVAKLYSSEDLKNYINAINSNKSKGSIKDNDFRIPAHKEQKFLFEECIETDKIIIKDKKINYTPKTGWIELTVGVLERSGKYHSLNPSITVVEGDVLSLEEKFQGGTGVNITPPDSTIIKNADNAIKIIKEKVEFSSKLMGIKNYARIDIFFNVLTNEVIIIEPNTLPGLTASTVFFQQAIKEEPSIMPLKIIETIIENKIDG